MNTNILEQIIYRSTSKPEAAFTAATTDLITSAAHGLQDGDLVQLTTATTLPAGLSLATNYYVINATTDTFKLSATPDGTAVDITDTGTGTHTFHLKGKAIYIGDAKDVTLSIGFSSTPTMTVKLQGAITAEDSCPDFNASNTVLNRWDNVMMYAVNQETGAGGESGVAGATGISCAGTAAFALYRITAKLSWICVQVTSFTAGYLDVRVSQFRQ